MSDNPLCETLASVAVAHGASLHLAGVEAHVEHAVTRVVTWDSAAVLSAVSLPPKERWLVTIRVYDARGRCGVVARKASTEAAIHKLVEGAVEKLSDAVPSPVAGPADRYKQTDVGLGIWDRRYPQIEDEDREEAVNTHIDDVRRVDGVEPMAFRYTEVVKTRAFHASNGNVRSERGTHYTLYGRVQTSDGEHSVEQTVRSRVFADVASLPLGVDLANQVVRYRNPKPISDKALPIVISPRAIARLMEVVVPAFDRDRVDAGQSFLTDGRRIGSEKLHLIDDALQPGGYQTRAFDQRGVPSLDLPLIREGCVGALYQGTELARELEGRPSGHAGPDGIWPGNLVLRAGTRSRNMIYPDLGPFLLLDDLVVSGEKWFDLTTGKLRLKGHFFSGAAGKDLDYVGILSLNTSYVELWSGIREVANDQQRFGSVDVSTWVVDGLEVG